MNGELISRKTRNAFREFLVGWTLREIEMVFEAAYVSYDRDFNPGLSGERRSFVEQHYHTLDFTSSADMRRLLTAYQDILETATRNLPDSYDKEAGRRSIENLIACLRKDGFKYEDSRITPTTPEARRVFDDVASGNSVSEITRRNILDALRADEMSWSGRLSETEFLGRLYDLDGLPSHDPRLKSARDDISQHRVNNPNDWPDDWVFGDTRFDLLHAPDEAFLRFLCEMIHPAVRPDDQEVAALFGLFNEHLAADGWEIAARTYISGKPVYAARRRVVEGSTTSAPVKAVAEVLNADYVTQQVTRMEASVQSDPELAIGTAKEFIETICKTILSECGKTVSGRVSLPQLVKQVRENLDLLPDSIPDRAKGAKTIKLILSNLGTVAQGLAELRGLYGTGHGKPAQVRGLEPRHARLAVGAASTLGVFFFETYLERKRKAAAGRQQAEGEQ